MSHAPVYIRYADFYSAQYGAYIRRLDVTGPLTVVDVQQTAGDFSDAPVIETVIVRKPGLLANDLWEHAYYLSYRNRRAEYLRAWFGIVNWTTIGNRLDAIRRGDEKSLGGPAH